MFMKLIPVIGYLGIHLAIMSPVNLSENISGNKQATYNETDYWNIQMVQPGLFNLYSSQKDKLNFFKIHGYPYLLEGKVLRTAQKELTDTLIYNWDCDTLYSYNCFVGENKYCESGIWNSSQGLSNGYRGNSMKISLEPMKRWSQSFIKIPNHHMTEYFEYLRQWDEYHFKRLFENASIYYALGGTNPNFANCCFSRLIIQEGRVVDVKVMYVTEMKWYVREEKEGFFYD